MAGKDTSDAAAYTPDELKTVPAPAPAPDEGRQVKKPIELEDAVNFMNKVKTRFQGSNNIHSFVVGILRRSGTENVLLPFEPLLYEEAYEMIKLMLRNQQDLIEELTNFLPNGDQPSPILFDELAHLLSTLLAAANLQDNQ